MIKARDPKVNLKVALWKAQKLIDFLEENQEVDLPQLAAAYHGLAALLEKDGQGGAAEEAAKNARAIQDIDAEGRGSHGDEAAATDALGNPLDPNAANQQMNNNNNAPIAAKGQNTISFQAVVDTNRPSSSSSLSRGASAGPPDSLSRGTSRGASRGAQWGDMSETTEICVSSASKKERNKDWSMMSNFLEKVYKEQNPEKVAEIPSVLEKMKGQEETLFKTLCEKYKLDTDSYEKFVAVKVTEEEIIATAHAEKQVRWSISIS
jgi:hypothetical protein